MKVAIILVAGSSAQNVCFWPSYFNSSSGVLHDLIVVHRNFKHLPFHMENTDGNVILENKCFKYGELPHKAFGAYRKYWDKYQNKYDYFAFISDDVVIKTNGWLAEAISMLDKYEKLGLVGTQIFNGNLKQYPHESHCRAPAWFAKSSALKKIKWEFNSDHEGEMKIAKQFIAAGYFGAQIGNKFDIAYDAKEYCDFYKAHHISVIMNEQLCGKDSAPQLISKSDRKLINDSLLYKLHNSIDDVDIISPVKHIGKRKLISQLQPFNGLIIDVAHGLAKSVSDEYDFGIRILK